MLKAVYIHIRKIADEVKKSQIISRICFMLEQTSDIFKQSTHLFLNHWQNYPNETVLNFIEYFKINWLVNNSNWFESWNYPNVCCPNTNNGNEVTNRVTKAEDTLRELLPTDHFFSVKKWAYSHCPTNTNVKPFASVLSIGTKSMTQGWQWQEKMKEINGIKQNSLEPNCFYCHSSTGVQITDLETIREYNKQIKHANWTEFDDFVNFAFGLWKITLPIDP